LQRTRKTVEGAQHPDRDEQVGYLNEQARSHLADGQPVASVDTKKKELVGNYANGGAEWQPSGVLVHDFPDKQLGKAIPYRVHDLGANTGWVSVGCDHDTASLRWRACAVGGRRWAGCCTRPLTGCWSAPTLAAATATGSGCGRPSWARFAAETGLAVTVCHFPPGTSKWNRSSTDCSATSP
jgi:Rhodopirellula transposase DDE domain